MRTLQLMNDNQQKLIRDTLTFLRSEGWIPSGKREVRAPMQPVQPARISQNAPIKRTAKLSPPISTPAERVPKRSVQQQGGQQRGSGHLLKTIGKHLPHIALIEEPGLQQEVAIVYSNDEELPFWRKLKQAIETHFCPVSLYKKESELDREFTALLIRGDSRRPHHISLASPTLYEDNSSEKKALWSKICQKLSPRSS